MRLTKEDQQALNTTLAPYLKTDVVQQMASYTQHGKVSTLSHCMNVARTSLLLSRKLHLNVDEQTMLVGALLHDFFLYDWHGSGWRHSYRHAERARRNAVTHFGVDERTQHVIRCHMWPMGITRVPMTREAILVNLSDKYNSLHETLFQRR
jgi:uncharacterized protein